jgi:hypothetical protein
MESLSDPLELQRCIRDLALSTFLEIRTSYGPQQIADSVARALVSMLSADFVYVVLPEEGGQSLIVVIHRGKGIASDSLRAVRDTLRRDLTRRPEQTAVIDNPAGRAPQNRRQNRTGASTANRSSHRAQREPLARSA